MKITHVQLVLQQEWGVFVGLVPFFKVLKLIGHHGLSTIVLHLWQSIQLLSKVLIYVVPKI